MKLSLFMIIVVSLILFNLVEFTLAEHLNVNVVLNDVEEIKNGDLVEITNGFFHKQEAVVMNVDVEKEVAIVGILFENSIDEIEVNLEDLKVVNDKGLNALKINKGSFFIGLFIVLVVLFMWVIRCKGRKIKK